MPVLQDRDDNPQSREKEFPRRCYFSSSINQSLCFNSSLLGLDLRFGRAKMDTTLITFMMYVPFFSPLIMFATFLRLKLAVVLLAACFVEAGPWDLRCYDVKERRVDGNGSDGW